MARHENRPNEGGEGGEELPPVWTEMGNVAGHGLTVAASTGAFLGLGWWLDGKVGSTPLLTILGALTGAAGGLYSIYHHMVVVPRDRAKRKGEGE